MKRYTREDVEAVEAIKEALEEQVGKLAQICRGDGWAEAYVINHLQSLISPFSRYDKGITDLLDEMKRSAGPASAETIELVKAAARKALQDGKCEPDADDLAYFIADDDHLPEDEMYERGESALQEWVFEAMKEVIAEVSHAQV